MAVGDPQAVPQGTPSGRRSSSGTERLGTEPLGQGLADRLRARTHALHVEAERSGIVVELLAGRACRYGYALFLRNLLPPYAGLEGGLDAHRHAAGLGALAQRAVYRAAAIASDLEALWGPRWADGLPLLASGRRYEQRVREAGRGNGSRLLAHAYARYLGDLSGGRILRRRVGRALDLAPGALSFYAYPEIADLDRFKASYRSAIDAAAPFVDTDAVVEESLAAFRLNIELSEEVRRAVGVRAGSAAPPLAQPGG